MMPGTSPGRRPYRRLDTSFRTMRCGPSNRPASARSRRSSSGRSPACPSSNVRRERGQVRTVSAMRFMPSGLWAKSITASAPFGRRQVFIRPGLSRTDGCSVRRPLLTYAGGTPNARAANVAQSAFSTLWRAVPPNVSGISASGMLPPPTCRCVASAQPCAAGPCPGGLLRKVRTTMSGRRCNTRGSTAEIGPDSAGTMSVPPRRSPSARISFTRAIVSRSSMPHSPRCSWVTLVTTATSAPSTTSPRRQMPPRAVSSTATWTRLSRRTLRAAPEPVQSPCSTTSSPTNTPLLEVRPAVRPAVSTRCAIRRVVVVFPLVPVIITIGMPRTGTSSAGLGSSLHRKLRACTPMPTVTRSSPSNTRPGNAS
jgi:hypothetical protein